MDEVRMLLNKVFGAGPKPSIHRLETELADYKNILKHSEQNSEAAAELLSAIRVFKDKFNMEFLLDHQRASSKETLEMLLSLNSACKILDEIAFTHSHISEASEKLEAAIDRIRAEELEKFEGEKQ